MYRNVLVVLLVCLAASLTEGCLTGCSSCDFLGLTCSECSSGYVLYTAICYPCSSGCDSCTATFSSSSGYVETKCDDIFHGGSEIPQYVWYIVAGVIVLVGICIAICCCSCRSNKQSVYQPQVLQLQQPIHSMWTPNQAIQQPMWGTNQPTQHQTMQQHTQPKVGL